MTKVRHELMSDADMHLFFEKGVGGGVSDISKIYSKASDKYLKSYDPKQESKSTIYFDGNSLYGYTMSQFLSASEIKRIDPNEIDLSKYNNSSTGSVLEVKYPKRLCELHNDYLLAPD